MAKYDIDNIISMSWIMIISIIFLRDVSLFQKFDYFRQYTDPLQYHNQEIKALASSLLMIKIEWFQTGTDFLNQLSHSFP